jgi:hypothetical protein
LIPKKTTSSVGQIFQASSSIAYDTSQTPNEGHNVSIAESRPSTIIDDRKRDRRRRDIDSRDRNVKTLTTNTTSIGTRKRATRVQKEDMTWAEITRTIMNTEVYFETDLENV